MRRVLVTLSLLVFLPASVGDARTTRSGKRKGKVVRVERNRADRVGMPRWCQIRPDGSASCYGKPPDMGDVGTVVDDVGRKASVRVTQLTPSIDSCGNTLSWEIMTETVAGDVTQSNYSWAALFDYTATANTRTIYNNGQIPVPGSRGPAESVWTAFDDDNDDNPEFIITYYSCDATGQVSQQGGPGYCMVYYGKGTGGYNELRVDIIRSC